MGIRPLTKTLHIYCYMEIDIQRDDYTNKTITEDKEKIK